MAQAERISERTLPLFGAAVPGGAQAAPPPRAADTAAAPLPPPGCGPLVQAAWPLLALLARLVGGAAATDAETLMRAAVALVRTFETAALGAGVSPREVAAARYSLCSAVDEAVLTTAWGQASGWNANTLLSQFHGETWGGEKVFGIVRRVLDAPGRYPALVELLYRLMLLGFQGQFRVERDGTAKADAVRDRLFQAIRAGGEPTPTLVPARPVQLRRRRGPIGFLPVWFIGVACLVVALSTFGYLRYELQDSALAEADRIAALTQFGVPPRFP